MVNISDYVSEPARGNFGICASSVYIPHIVFKGIATLKWLEELGVPESDHERNVGSMVEGVYELIRLTMVNEGITDEADKH